jgi:O-methyltransferase involved in polyketide biosynthesis
MKNSTSDNDHSRISPTAKITAYWRSLSDIPFSKEIAEAVGAEQTAREILGDRIVEMGSISPAMFEVRYKSINYGLKKSGINNIMELASGLSPRGLEIVSNGGIYVGTDLPYMYSESSPVINAIADRSRVPMNNLHLMPANVLEKQELENAAAHFKGKNFAVCNEGLLMYLDKNEKKKMAENIRGLLLQNKGCWITTDIVFKVLREAIATIFGSGARKVIQPALKNISDITGRDIAVNDFADKSEAVKFYEDLGFTIEEFSMYNDEYELSIASRIRDNYRERFLEILSSVKAWIMTPKG